MTDQQQAPYQAANYIQQHAPTIKPKYAIVLGSGLSGFAEHLTERTTIPYADIPGFASSAVAGHQSQCTLGLLANTPIVCLQGRSHLYEGLHAYDLMKTYIRSMKLLGCEQLILTNAAGSLHQSIPPGELVMIRDHINFHPGNPLMGPNDDDFGTRFPALDNTYTARLRERLRMCAQKLSITLYEGVYIAALGPSFETAAEIEAFRRLGADVVGMSTVPEAIIATHCGLQVAAISTITNYATGIATTSHDHNEVLRIAASSAEKLMRLITAFVD